MKEPKENLKRKKWLFPVIVGGVLVLLGAFVAIKWNDILSLFQYDEISDQKDPTCLEDGYVLWQNEFGQSKTEVLPALGHEPGQVNNIVVRNCTQDGKQNRKCTRCGAVVEETTVPAYGHEWTEATCTTAKYCTRCNVKEGEALGHNYVDEVCTRCNHVFCSEGLSIKGGVLYGMGTCTDADVVIPEGVIEIAERAFCECEILRSVIIPNGVTCIHNSAFEDCKSLEKVTLPNTLITIEDDAFRGCISLTEIKIPNSVTEIGRCAFGYSGLKSLFIPAGVTSLWNPAIACKALKSLAVDPENSVYDSRNDCNAIIITATNILMNGCVSTQIPEGIKEIGDFAFIRIPIITCTIPMGVTEIGIDAFYECDELESITIPTSVKAIWYEAFRECNNLTIKYQGSKAQWEKIRKDSIGISDDIVMFE